MPAPDRQNKIPERFSAILRVSNFAQFSPRQGPSIAAKIRLLDSGATVARSSFTDRQIRS
jgi:hypothetical protein